MLLLLHLFLEPINATFLASSMNMLSLARDHQFIPLLRWILMMKLNPGHLLTLISSMKTTYLMHMGNLTNVLLPTSILFFTFLQTLALTKTIPSSLLFPVIQPSSQDPGWDSPRRFFTLAAASSIQDTHKVTTRYGAAPPSQDSVKKPCKSHNPVLTSLPAMRLLLLILSFLRSQLLMMVLNCA